MLIVKNHLLSGIVNLIITVVARVIKFVYKTLKAMHLRFLAVVVLSGAFLQVFYKKLTLNPTYFIIFLTLVSVGIIRIIYLFLNKYLYSNKQAVESVQAVNTPTQNQEWQGATSQQNDAPSEKSFKPIQKLSKKPKYFRVLQNPRYLMAEYEDRVELFYEDGTSLKHIKTDYKQTGNTYGQ